MTTGSVWTFTRKHGLSRFEHVCCDERFVSAIKCLAGLADAHQANVEPVVENCGQAINRDRPPAAVSETAAEHLRRQIKHRESSRAVERERLPYEWPSHRIDSLYLGSALVEVADRGAKRIEPLF